jgi:Leucine-rich repeat (LRR) protein
MKNLLLVLALAVLLSACSLSDNSQIVPINNTETDGELKNIDQQTGDKLDLSGQNLEKIPGYVFGLKNLEELDLSNNKLTGAIQAEIRHLQSLKVLNAENNQMTGVPAEIGQLSNLEVLNLSNNQLTGLPYELGNLQKLKTLNISGNKYSELDLGIITEKLPQSVNIIK